MNLTDKRILVTGGNGFLGRHVVAELKRRGCNRIYVWSRAAVYHGDLQYEPGCQDAVGGKDIVVHIAANCGGIGANQKTPADFFTINARMGINLMEYARQAGVTKYLQIGTVCSYPKHCPVPFKESDLWNGYPEETNAPYGLAKRMLIVQAQAYRQQYGFNAVTIIPTNLYGPGDNFDPNSSHVIPALIRKCIEAREAGSDSVEVWGDGSATRDFLYVEDAARGIVDALETYDSPEPMNLGGGVEWKIADVVSVVKRHTGFAGSITYDSRNPNGQPRRLLDCGKARASIWWNPTLTLGEGIEHTVEWYESQRAAECQSH